MKKYQSPRFDIKKIISDKGISSLSDWLVSNDLNDAGITTYIVNS